MPEIKNLPDYAKDCRFVVARKVDSEFWFWGAYEEWYYAVKVMLEINGTMFDNYKKVSIENTTKNNAIIQILHHD